jgi:chloramphenicol-sensitive protein RarD
LEQNTRNQQHVLNPNPINENASVRTGIIFALLAQMIWGLFPLYLELLRPTPGVEIVAHRIVWSFCFLLLLVVVASCFKSIGLPRWSNIKAVWADRKMLGLLALASVLILANWLGFVMAVTLDRVMDASVGYYICPQVVVLLGVLFEKEELSRAQWIAFVCSSVGVLVMAGSTAGIPWLGLVVAFSFGFYALLKKRIRCHALTSLAFETGLIWIPAAAFLIYRNSLDLPVDPEAEKAMVSPTMLRTLLLLTGVATVLPLALYVGSVKRIPLSMAGLLQFVGPTIQFLLSVFIFKNSFDWPRVVGIVLVWIGVAFYLKAMHRKRAKPVNR